MGKLVDQLVQEHLDKVQGDGANTFPERESDDAIIHVLLQIARRVNTAAPDIGGGDVTGTAMQIDTGDHSTLPGLKYTTIRIIPTGGSVLIYKGEEHTEPWNLNADIGRFYPAITGTDGLGANDIEGGTFNWIGWF